jgi:arginine utilization protein RocB
MGEEKFEKVLKEIDTLADMMRDGLFTTPQRDWKAIWEHIRKTGADFKGVRFPSPEQHHKAWNQFQELVAKVKEKQNEDKKVWEEKKYKSNEFKKEIIRLAESAKPSGPGGDVLLAIITGGVSAALSAFMGPYDERKNELKSCGEQLKKGYSLLNKHKDEMTARDKKEAYAALTDAQSNLNAAWEEHNKNRQEAFETYKSQQQQKHNDWVQRVEANISKLESRRNRLTDIISHKENHLDELNDKLRNAWSDDFRERVSGWIQEEEASISELNRQLNDVETWLHEAREKLR